MKGWQGVPRRRELPASQEAGLRCEITLEPGGEIAKHSHAERPGFAYTASGSWVEGRANGEIAYPAGKDKGSTIIEDADTVHWIFNDDSASAKVLVCDIVASPS
ncbi:MAG: hypothetical protein BMS9Abin01_2548 [Gammaproteobacteria bacterium]|nr:MAG: hypothetical protein BMS9Abin01_2548 [Gammaproteobacteria bacterium]